MDSANPIQSNVPVVPVSSQPLTLDPNLMSVPNQAQQQTPSQPVPAAQSRQTTPTQQVPPAQQTVSAQPRQPISGPHKELGPMIQAPLSEVLRPTEVQPQLHPEVQEAGVEVVENNEHPQLTAEHKAAGIEHAKESTPLVVSSSAPIQLPYTLQDAKTIEKQVSRSESRHWLAALTEYIWRKLQTVSN